MATSEVVDSEIKITKKTDNGKKVQDMLTTPETVFNLLLCALVWLVMFTMYHNYMEIGFPFRLVSFFYRKYVNDELYILSSIGVVVTLSIHYMLTLLVEKTLLKRAISEEAALTAYILIMISSLASPIVWFTYVAIPGGNRSILITCSCYAFMKMISYYQVNKQHRIAYFKSDHKKESELQQPTNRKLVKYPDNLNLKDVLYFTFVPTYCYDLNIKRDDHFKWMDLIVQVGHFLLGAEAMLNVLDHLINPQLEDFYEDPGFFQFYGYKHFLHCAVKASLLAWPLVALTLLCCYIVLYKTLAVLAVILRYPERSFCGEWWNVTETKDYWAKWNLPVHKWLIKHLYRPCKEAGITTLMSALVTFVFSGVLHDYAIMAVMEVNTYFVVTLVMIYSVAGIPYTRAVKRIFGPHISNIHILQMWYFSAVGAIMFQYKKKM